MSKDRIMTNTNDKNLHQIRAGRVTLSSNVILAPLAGITDYPFRKIASGYGPGLTVTEMISARALCHGNMKTTRMATPGIDEHMVSVQLFGANPQHMKDAAIICQNLGAPMIDINMGCPQKKIIKSGAGAALMKTPELAAAIVEAIASGVNVPVTVKIRLGWDSRSINAPEFAHLMEDAGASMITVHARTKTQMFGGNTDWKAIRSVKESVKIPVVANGDILSVQDAEQCLMESGADGVMIGRGALGRPWFLRQVADYLSGNQELFQPDLRHVSKTIDQHLELIDRYYSEPASTWMFRKHLAWYTKGMKHSAMFRDTLFRVAGIENLKALKKDFFETFQD